MNVEPRLQGITAEIKAVTRYDTEEGRVRGLEATLRRRDAVLSAVCYAASNFLGTAEWDRNLDEWLGRLGGAAEVTRVFLFEAYVDAAGVLRRRMRGEWSAPGVDALASDSALADIEVESVGLGRWRLMEQTGAMYGPVSLLPPRERDSYVRLGAGSFAAVPIFTGSSWWGYIGLTDVPSAREWSRSVLEALEAAAATLGAAIHRKQGEERLQQSEERYRLLTEAAFEGVLIHDAGRMLEANPAFARIFGYEVGELLGRNVIDLIPTAESRALIMERMGSGSEEPYEVTGRRKDGTLITAEITGRRTFYRGKPARVVTIHDITARTRSEAELRRREAQLADAQAIAHMGSWVWDVETKELTGSDEMYRIYGFELGTPLPTDAILSGIHPDDAGLVRRHIDDAVENARDFGVEHRVLQPSGEVRLVRAQGRIVTDAAGRSTKIIGTGHDITERREAEEVARRLVQERAARAAAEQAEHRAAMLAEASRLLGTSFDYQTTLSQLTRLAVPAFADFCTVDLVRSDDSIERIGVAHVDPAKEPLLFELARWVKPGAPMVEHLRRALVERESTLSPRLTDEVIAGVQLDEEHGRLLRALRPVSFVSVPLHVNGRVTGVLALYTAESGRVYDQDDLALVEELARRASLAVENARLFNEAQLATRARDQMLGIVAHDLRNPLGTMLMASQLLEETLPVDAPARRQVAMMTRAGKQMNRLIQDLLDVKRIESGRLAVEPRPVPAIALLVEALEMLRSLASARSLELSLDTPHELPGVVADPQRIQQVLGNLVGNAIKFTPQGGRITVRGSPLTGEVRVAVEDTGPGIPAEQLPHVFGQFWQGTRTDKRGIGLGLAIAKAIVEAHNGRIWVESTVGAGSSFYFTLPTQG
jgi:PAS domain S-box-containing protein